MRFALVFRLVALFLVSAAFLSGGETVNAGNVKRAGKISDGVFLEVSLSEGKTIVGVPVLYEVSVISSTPDLSLLSGPSHLDWAGLEVSPLAGESRFRKVMVKKQVMYKAVISRYWLSSGVAGKFHLPAPHYILGIPKEKIIRDPFWGDMRQAYYEPLELEAPSLSFKVEGLPAVPSGFNFSGAVGDFDVNVWIPDGYIASGQEAIAIVNISGKGDLSSASIPDLKEAFSGNARLKSVKEERSSYVKDGALCSEIELEVTFIPLSDDEGNHPTIGEVNFGFFSPTKNKYFNASSSPVEVPLGSSSRRKSNPTQYGV